MTTFKRTATILFATICIATFQTSAFAQVSGKAFEGFRGNSKDPIQTDADSLEIEDGNARAVFTGNVRVRQGKSLITADKLIVHYLKGGSGGQTDIEKLEFIGNMIATSEENTASANKGVFHVQTEDIILEGKVVISQAGNIATGCKLAANLKSNIAKFVKVPGCRITTSLNPNASN